MKKFLRWNETTCATCGTFLHVREDIPPPHYCVKHEGGQTMAPRKKKDFSEAVKASDNGNGREPVIRKRYKEKLPVKIDSALWAQKAAAMADAFERQAAIEERRREAMAEFRQEVAGVKEEMKGLAASVREHTEIREVEVIERLWPERGLVEIVRTDTNEIIDSRNASSSDMQEGLFERPSQSQITEPDLEEEDDDEGEWTKGPNPKPIADQPS